MRCEEAPLRSDICLTLTLNYVAIQLCRTAAEADDMKLMDLWRHIRNVSHIAAHIQSSYLGIMQQSKRWASEKVKESMIQIHWVMALNVWLVLGVCVME